MSAPRHHGLFFLPPSDIDEQRLVLEGADAHHLQVRRARPGDRIQVSDGAGRVAGAVIEQMSSDRVVAAASDVEYTDAPLTRLVVFQGLAKSGRVDWAVEKMVELGVDEVAVFAAGRSVPRWSEDKAAVMRQRWERVALAASKQSRRARLPVVSGPWTPEVLQERVRSLNAVLVADPTAPADLRGHLKRIGRVETLGLVIGPEGGLEPAEIQGLVHAGAHPVGLGSQVLRTETAGLALAAVVLHHLGRLG